MFQTVFIHASFIYFALTELNHMWFEWPLIVEQLQFIYMHTGYTEKSGYAGDNL